MSVSLNESLKPANLTQDEIASAEKLVVAALNWPGSGYFVAEKQFVLAILVAHYRLQQRARGKKSKGLLKEKAERRTNHVNLLLRVFVHKRYRKRPTSEATVIEIIRLLDEVMGEEASVPQARRAIHAAMKLGPLPTD